MARLLDPNELALTSGATQSLITPSLAAYYAREEEIKRKRLKPPEIKPKEKPKNILEKFLDNPVSRFKERALDSALQGLTLGLLKSPQPPAQNFADKTADVIGNIAGMALPVGGAYATGGKLAGNLATKATAKLAPTLAKGLTRAATGAGAGATLGAVEGLINRDAPEELAKRIGTNAALFGVGDVALHGAGKAIKPLVNKLKPGTLKPKSVEVPNLAKQQIATTENIDVTKLKDIGGFRAYTSDVYRNFRDVFGEQFNQVKKRILDPFDEAKKANIDMQKYWANKLKTEVVDRLGIKKGSKESALVQQYGEKKISLEELKKLRPNDWQKIVEADKWFRKAYDQLLDEVNAVRAKIYPNNPDKIIPKRKDYYRHFRELTDTIEGVKNLFETPAAIDPHLAGVSDFTLPKSRFASFMQKRGLGPYKNDAVGGFLDYLPAASYAKNIDPHIGKFEALANELAESTAETRNLNNFIEYLRDFARDLAGKTNPADRFFQKIIPGGRMTFRLINWLNNRIKANAVLGNAGSALSQLANIPQGIAFAKQYSAAGFGRTVKNILTKSKGPMSESGFLAERYASADIYRQFDTKLLDKPKQFAAWMLEAVDRIGTEFIWNSAYAKGVAEGVTNPVKYADEVTRSLVAGRGIGEVPLLQKSRLFQIIAPFQLEAANLWNVQRDFVKAKDFGALVGLYLANFLFNRVMEETKGSAVTFDPIDAIIDAFTEEGATIKQKAGRLAGEVLSNMPLGQTIASQLPEDKRKELFGRENPTRFGTGLLVTKGLQNPLYKVLPPFGGTQLEKTVKGSAALGLSPVDKVPIPGVYNKDKTQIKYPVKRDLTNTVKGLLFGTTGLRETKDYYDNNRRPLGPKQTKEFIEKAKQGQDPELMYQKLQIIRQINSIDEEIKELRKNFTPDKEKRIDALKLQKARLEKELRGGK